MTFYFGAHIDNIPDIITNVQKIKNSGGNFVQIMFSKKITYSHLKILKNYFKKNNIKVVVHGSYLYNLAQNWNKYSWWIEYLEEEIKKTHFIGANGLVLHFGNQKQLTKAVAYNNMYSALIYIHNKTKKYNNVKLLLETPAGQGSVLCYTLEDLSHFYKKFSQSKNIQLKKRIKLCIDTCHIFAAGYDIRSTQQIKLFLKTFEKLIGLRYVKLIHLNDSKCDIGCRKDRHENIGKGMIGKKGLTILFNYFKKINIPIILETPNFKYDKEIQLLI